MKYTVILVITLCVGHVTAQGLMDMFLGFADLNGGIGMDTNNDTNTMDWGNDTFWDWPDFPTEPTTWPPEPTLPSQPVKPDVPGKPDVPNQPNTPSNNGSSEVGIPNIGMPLGPISIPGGSSDAGIPNIGMPLGPISIPGGSSDVGIANIGMPLGPVSIPGGSSDVGIPNIGMPLGPISIPGQIDTVSLPDTTGVGNNNNVPSVNVLEPQGVDPTSNAIDWASHFLPAMPTGDEFVNLKTGDTKQFIPGFNWLEGSDPAVVGISTTAPVTTTTASTTTISIPTTTVRRTKPTTTTEETFVNNPIVPIVGGDGQNINKPDIGNTIPTKDEVLPPVKETPVAHLPVPVDTSSGLTGGSVGTQGVIIDPGVPLGPVEIKPVDMVPGGRVEGEGNNKKGVPSTWMQLYPDGRQPSRNGTVATSSVDAPVLTQRELWMAQNTLGNFGRNRQEMQQYRKERRENAKRQRELRKQQRNRNRGNRGKPDKQSNKSTGPKGAHIAKMVKPGNKKPFVGKNQRGRPSQSKRCNRLQRHLGRC